MYVTEHVVKRAGERVVTMSGRGTSRSVVRVTWWMPAVAPLALISLLRPSFGRYPLQFCASSKDRDAGLRATFFAGAAAYSA